MDVKEDKKVTKKKPAKKKAKFHFIKPFPTSKKVFKVDDPCFEENEKVLRYLITNKFIK